MAVNYTRLAATAKTLIEENGRDIVLIRKSLTPADSAKPWRGPTAPGNTTVGTVKAVIYPVTEKDVDGELVRMGMMKAWIAHTSLPTPEDLSDVTAITDDGTLYKVVKANVLGPGNTVLAYEFVLEE